METDYGTDDTYASCAETHCAGGSRSLQDHADELGGAPPRAAGPARAVCHRHHRQPDPARHRPTGKRDAERADGRRPAGRGINL